MSKKSKPLEFKEPLYACEHDGRSYAGNCGGCQLDKNHWGWEFKSDCYYNTPPAYISEESGWTNVESGLYVTQSIVAVVRLLRAPPSLADYYQYKPVVTPRAVSALNALGYCITLRRYTVQSVIRVLEVEVSHLANGMTSERITKNETTVNGKVV